MKKAILFLTILSPLFGFSQESENEIEQIAKEINLLRVELSISPNPSYGSLVIQAPEGSSCTIVSVTGTYVGTWMVGEEGLALEDFPTGTYIARISCQEGEKSKKFIVL